MDNYDPMITEHEAWLVFCATLREQGIEINDHDKIAKAACLWGEELVNLRCGQSEELRAANLERARNDADGLALL